MTLVCLFICLFVHPSVCLFVRIIILEKKQAHPYTLFEYVVEAGNDKLPIENRHCILRLSLKCQNILQCIGRSFHYTVLLYTVTILLYVKYVGYEEFPIENQHCSFKGSGFTHISNFKIHYVLRGVSFIFGITPENCLRYLIYNVYRL